MMKKCKSCQSDIDQKATRCPHCQTDQRSWFRRHPILSAILILFIVGLISASGRKNSTSDTSFKDLITNVTPSSSTTTPIIIQPSPTLTPKVALKLDTMAWVKEYDKNKLVANDKYKGKYVEFSGKIKNITESFGTPYLSLEPPNAGSFYLGTTIKCDFTSKEPLKSLENETVVTLRGTVNEQTFGVIGVSDCAVVK